MLAAVEAASALLGPSVREILSRSREARIVRARHLAMRALYDTGRFAMSEIGLFFRRDHSSVVHAVRATRYRARTDVTIENKLQVIRKAVEACDSSAREVGLRGRAYRHTYHMPVYVVTASVGLRRWLKENGDETRLGHLIDVNFLAMRLVPKDILPIVRVEGGGHRYLLIKLEDV